MMKELFARYRMAFIMLVAILIHGAAFAFIRFALPDKDAEKKESYDVFKLVDVDEYVPPPPVAPPSDTTIVYNQPESSETVVETEKEIIETSDASYSNAVVEEPEIVYVPQHKISVIPEIPTKDILARIDYPPIALRQGIEGVVYLELFIDQAGAIRKISVLKDPGFGFADAAIAALDGIRCKPAMANGVPVATRFRYPVRFTIK
jgi:periplasmic protein TonB